MFAGIQNYGTVYGNRPYRREIGETPQDMEKAVKWMDEQDKKATTRMPREIGEDPAEAAKPVARGNVQTATRPDRAPRPREIGEDPAEVAKANAEASKKGSEMTEQEKRLDLFA